MILFRLTHSTIRVRRTWIVVFLLALILPFTLPYLTPWEANVKLIPPARAHTAWMLAWLIGIFWTLMQAASSGDANSRTGIGAYLRSRGIKPLAQMAGIWSAIMLWLLPVVAGATLIPIFFARPGDPEEARMWIWTNLQFATLYLLTIGPLALLAVALASRFGSMVGFVIPAGLCGYGLFGVNYLGMTVRMRDNPPLEWLYVISPHYHLADLTPRLIFKMGNLAAADFAIYSAYFCGLALVFTALATVLFRTDPLRS